MTDLALIEQSKLSRSNGCKSEQSEFVQASFVLQGRTREYGCNCKQSHFLHIARSGHSSGRGIGCKNLQLLILH